jgi:uncharacterized protein (TIGR02246 family)
MRMDQVFNPRLASNYSKHCCTCAQVRTTPEEIEDYFTYFLKLKPNGKIDSSYVRLLGPETAINSGIYTFDVVSNGVPAKVQARYSFTYKKIGSQWLIIDHHSSGMPEK